VGDFFYLKTTTLSYTIYNSVSKLPEGWNQLAVQNIFLSKEYLEVLEKSSPVNMTCHFIGFFDENKLCGIALSQFLDVNKLDSFGERDQCGKKIIRNFIFKNFSSHVLFIGNNMLTGQNAFSFLPTIDKKLAIESLKKASEELISIFKNKKIKIHLVTFKDFDSDEIQDIEKVNFTDYFKFSIQPNMLFEINENWKSEENYIESLSKKYRDQYKRARKKSAEIVKRKMHLDEIIKYEETIYDLYFHVAKNAPFNTFFLAKNHFRIFKELLKDKFLFYGYFIEDKLVGFNTLIKNGDAMDTYFLGYDDKIQRDKMLYLNMLYDMIAYSINKGFKKIVFARTALEIKSSVGAKPIKMFGIIKHQNKSINKYMDKIFPYLEPEVKWQERNPFK
jgi:predicted N-acyltransferase